MQRLMRGPTLSLLSRSGLWLAEDHLLSVEQRGMEERYRRFYFEDIQALVITRTERRLIVGLLLGAFLAIGLLTLAFAGGTGTRIFGGVVTALFGALSLINFLKGPGCVCDLRTSVSVTRLPAVRRVTKIERALPPLQARIRERQGEREAQEIAVDFASRQQSSAAAAEPTAAETPAAGPATRVSPRSSGRLYAGGFHLALFGLLLFDAVLVLLVFVVNHPVSIGLRMAAVLLGLFCAIVGLTRQKGAGVSVGLHATTVAGLVYLAVGALAIYGLIVTLQVQYADTSANTLDVLRVLAESSPYDGIGWLILYTANAALSGLLGALGLLQTMNFRSQRPQAIPTPPLPSGP